MNNHDMMDDMGEFAVGDRVVRIKEPLSSDKPFMEKGGEYVVSEVCVFGADIRLCGDDRSFSRRYFRRVSAKPKRDYVSDHMRRTLRKAGLTKEEAAKFTANTPAEKRSAFSRKLPKWPMISTRSFSWDDSPEGFEYWYDICRRTNGLTKKPA